jgi:cytochrome c553
MQLTRVVSIVAALEVAVLSASCANTPAADAQPVAGKTWAQMSKGERMTRMKNVVFPEMKTAFQSADPKDFAQFTCATCHGAGAADKTFRMPNPQLPKLPGDEAGMKRVAADDPAMVKFMSGVVVPRMAAMLDEPPYDPKTHQGFGCFRCHTRE